MIDWDWRGYLALTVIAMVVGTLMALVEVRLEERYPKLSDLRGICEEKPDYRDYRRRLLARQFRKTTEG